jgi:transcriptional regulator with XRE-family HTH domain
MAGKGISIARATRVVNQQTLANVAGPAGITPSHLSRIERGLREISPEVMKRLAATLKVPPEKLFSEVGE